MSSEHDFDFLHGAWLRHERRLRWTPGGSSEWQEFDGTSIVRPVWDGQGNIEDDRSAGPDGPMHTVRMHLFDPRTRQWSLRWADRATGTLGAPAMGEFQDGRGQFFGFGEFQGRRAMLRLTWTSVGCTEAGLEQAISADGGRTWTVVSVTRLTRASPAETDPVSAAWPTATKTLEGGSDPIRGFDFLHGEWSVHNRRLRRPLSGSAEWYAFEGSAVERAFWDGQGNLEEYEGHSPAGRIRGLALRLYDPVARQWSIHWANSATGEWERPMVGQFRDGRGEFYNLDRYDGREVMTRFIWTSAGEHSARWEQAFSDDGGRSWETNWTMDFHRGPTPAPSPAPSDPRCSAVVELRRYTLHPGQRETMIALFEREFIESQEADGMTVIAQFRDIDRPNTFTWMRGFPDLAARQASLGAFYGGPVWAANRDAANGTIVSSDNVYLLRPARPGSGIPIGERGSAPGAADASGGILMAVIYTLAAPAAEGFTEVFERMVAPELTAAGATPIAMLETEPGANSFPRLPVREGEHSFVWFARLADAAAYDRWKARIAGSKRWSEVIRPLLEKYLQGPAEIWPVEILRLEPTARSRPIK